MTFCAVNDFSNHWYSLFRASSKCCVIEIAHHTYNVLMNCKQVLLFWVIASLDNPLRSAERTLYSVCTVGTT